MEEVKSSTCPGHCCDGFTMSTTKENRQRSIEAKAAGFDHYITTDGEVHHSFLYDEFVSPEFINDMLIEKGPAENGNMLHTCKYWDRETRLCTIYDTRPGLCRRFPILDQPCEFAHLGCTFIRKTPEGVEIKATQLAQTNDNGNEQGTAE